MRIKIGEAARLLGISDGTLRNLSNDNYLEPVHISIEGTRYYDSETIKADYLRANFFKGLDLDSHEGMIIYFDEKKKFLRVEKVNVVYHVDTDTVSMKDFQVSLKDYLLFREKAKEIGFNYMFGFRILFCEKSQFLASMKKRVFKQSLLQDGSISKVYEEIVNRFFDYTRVQFTIVVTRDSFSYKVVFANDFLDSDYSYLVDLDDQDEYSTLLRWTVGDGFRLKGMNLISGKLIEVPKESFHRRKFTFTVSYNLVYSLFMEEEISWSKATILFNLRHMARNLTQEALMICREDDVEDKAELKRLMTGGY